MARQRNILSFFNALWIFALLLGCSGSNPVTPPPDGGVDGGTDGGVDGGTDGGTCVNTIVQAPYIQPDECRTHLCFSESECALPQFANPFYPHNPPIGGPHYWVWAKWGVHTEVVPRGYWVHNLEHGAVVFLYRPNAPQSIKDAIMRVFNNIPLLPDSVWPACCQEPGCQNHRRVVVTPDPLLDTPWAVTVSGPEEAYCVGSGYYIKSDCIASEQMLVDFAVQHRGMGVEPVCDEGFYPF